MIQNQILILLIILFSCNSLLAAEEHAQAKITLKVVDEQNIPLNGARAGITFEELLFWDSKSIPVNGTTNSDGFFTASGKTSKRAFWGSDITGYYPSNGTIIFDRNKDGRWEPWNPEVTVVLRKKENPVPMYVRDTKYSSKYMMVPVVGKEVGFDLIEYDWMPPYGKGKTTDFILKAERTYVNDRDFDSTLTITFPNAFDGIQLHREDRRYGSIFKLPRFAPESGYAPKLVVKKTMVPKKGLTNNSDENNNYFFRVRSEEKDGKLVRAMYGKIHGDIDIDPRGNDSVVIVIKYYLNPDYTRNMEFGRNLFKGLNVGRGNIGVRPTHLTIDLSGNWLNNLKGK